MVATILLARTGAQLSAYAAEPRGAEVRSPQPVEALEVEVQRNRVLNDEAIISLAGLNQDPTLSSVEVERRLMTCGLFSKVKVSRTARTVVIRVEEKTSWFALPYFSADSTSQVFGVLAAKAALMGSTGNIAGRYQFGRNDHRASFILRDEYFLDTSWIAGVSFDYEDAVHRIFSGREVTRTTRNYYVGPTFTLGYHVTAYLTLSLRNYWETHEFEDDRGRRFAGNQVSHRAVLDWGNFTVNEGLARGQEIRAYLESSNPASDFNFRKYGFASQVSAYLHGDLNWITRWRAEASTPPPYYQRFELGAEKLRGFPTEMFRDTAYFEVQNDVLLASWTIGKFRFRPLTYLDWAYVEGTGRTGIGAGLEVFARSVAVPALQLFAGYGFNPNGFSATIAVGPRF